MLVLLVLAVLFPSPFQARQVVGGPARDYQDPEAYIIYSTILPSDWIIRNARARHLVILRETRVYKMCLNPEREFEQTVGPANDYTRINSSPWLLQDKFDTGLSYELISNEQLTSTLGKGNWENFHLYYPDSKGFLEFSAVGFNEDKTIAVVYMGHSCVLLCGEGGFHVLEKKEGKWVPLQWKGSSCSWVS